MSGMAKVEDPHTKPPIPQESALLKCEHCGNADRVWLNRCKRCSSPEVNWYEARIAMLEETIVSQDKLIRNQADLLNNYSAELKRLKPAWKERE
jgi:primosomal protein N'